MTFSKRIGLEPEKKPLQIISIDDELRISIYNMFKEFEVASRNKYWETNRKHLTDYYRKLYRKIWTDFFIKDVDDYNKKDNHGVIIKELYIKLDWNKIYDYLEFYAQLNVVYEDKFVLSVNKVLATHNSGYRLIDNKIVAITVENELQEVSEATKTPYDAVNQHMKQAIEIFSNRDTEDYRNTIKEAISAVEAMANVVYGSEGKPLSEALKKISEKIPIHKSLEDALIKIYGYTSDKNSGIRHYLTDDAKNEPDFADAKFMLVSCSAFINYLILKSNKT